MVDNSYTASVFVALLVVAMCIVIYKVANSPIRTDSDNTNYIKIKGKLISVPKDIYDAMLSKYTHKLISIAKKNTNINMNLLNQIERTLEQHIQYKYGIKFTLYPNELDNYIINLGIPQSNKYDGELVGGVDMDDKTRKIGVIIWYLETIMIRSKNLTVIEIPVILDEIDNIDTQDIKKSNKIFEQVEERSIPIDVVDMIDRKEFRVPIKSAPKKCSNLRYDLMNYISDSAAQDWDNIFAGDETNQKAKNTREAAAGWQKTNIFRMADTTHARDGVFGDSHNRQHNPIFNYAGYDLPLKMMKDEQLNKPTRNQKQSLTDDWNYLEEQFLAQ
jgi:hypothetical protein